MRAQTDSLRIINEARGEQRRAGLLKTVGLSRNSTMVVGWKFPRW